MGRTRENQGIYILNSLEKGVVVSERRKAQLHKIKEVRDYTSLILCNCAFLLSETIAPFSQLLRI